MKKIIAYDFDGVLCPMAKRDKPFFKQSGEERKIYNFLKLEYIKNAPLIFKPKEKNFYIISARRERFRLETEEWLKKHNIKPIETILMENISLTFEHCVEHKLNWLKKLKVNKFYEDDVKIVRYLKKKLPLLEIVTIPRLVFVINCVLPNKNANLYQ
jgi:uncharacterized HAD superfamily protein